MFKEMRRQDRKLSDEKAIEILEKGQYGVLSTTGENGYAYGVALNYVYFDNAIYFHCALEGHKIDNIRYCNKVSFCVIGETMAIPESFSYSFESSICFGQAFEIDGEEKIRALVAIVKKYSNEFKEKGMQYISKDAPKTIVVKINIEHLTAKKGK